MQYQLDDGSEDFKIASFVSMVDGCSVIGVPYSPTTGLCLVFWLLHSVLFFIVGQF